MRWTIRKKYGGVRRVYDTVGASILGPDTEPVEVVPASFTDEDVERVAEAWMRALYGAEAFEDIGVEDNDRQVARAALTAYLEDKA